jgi:hypothetical protein
MENNQEWSNLQNCSTKNAQYNHMHWVEDISHIIKWILLKSCQKAFH